MVLLENLKLLPMVTKEFQKSEQEFLCWLNKYTKTGQMTIRKPTYTKCLQKQSMRNNAESTTEINIHGINFMRTAK